MKLLNFLSIITYIIVHNIIAENPIAIQKPIKLNLNLKARMHPRGNAINQYEIKLDNITILVLLIPLKMPDNVTCKPSNIWKQHNI